MNKFWLSYALLLIALTSGGVRAQVAKPLTELTPVTSGLQKEDRPFSLGGRVMHYGLGSVGGWAASDSFFSVYELGGKYSRFTAWVGVPDGHSPSSDMRYVVRTDGNAVVDNKDDLMSPTSAPVQIDIDVTGVQSLKIGATNSLFFGEPTLYKSVPQSSGIAVLTAPASGVTVTGSSITLAWEPVSGATSYGVEIVCTKGRLAHIYSLNVTGGESNAKFSVADVPSGRYEWSIIAFDSNGVMGKFSKSRTFLVTK